VHNLTFTTRGVRLVDQQGMLLDSMTDTTTSQDSKIECKSGEMLTLKKSKSLGIKSIKNIGRLTLIELISGQKQIPL